jgi:hypothetical protein
MSKPYGTRKFHSVTTGRRRPPEPAVLFRDACAATLEGRGGRESARKDATCSWRVPSLTAISLWLCRKCVGFTHSSEELLNAPFPSGFLS